MLITIQSRKEREKPAAVASKFIDNEMPRRRRRVHAPLLEAVGPRDEGRWGRRRRRGSCRVVVGR